MNHGCRIIIAVSINLALSSCMSNTAISSSVKEEVVSFASGVTVTISDSADLFAGREIVKNDGDSDCEDGHTGWSYGFPMGDCDFTGLEPSQRSKWLHISQGVAPPPIVAGPVPANKPAFQYHINLIRKLNNSERYTQAGIEKICEMESSPLPADIESSIKVIPKFDSAALVGGPKVFFIHEVGRRKCEPLPWDIRERHTAFLDAELRVDVPPAGKWQLRAEVYGKFADPFKKVGEMNPMARVHFRDQSTVCDLPTPSAQPIESEIQFHNVALQNFHCNIIYDYDASSPYLFLSQLHLRVSDFGLVGIEKAVLTWTRVPE
jgi:hypothetical protein